MAERSQAAGTEIALADGFGIMGLPNSDEAYAASSPVRTATDAGRHDDRRVLHDDEPRSLQVIDKALGDDAGHDLAGVVNPLALVVPNRERKSVGESSDGRALIGRLGLCYEETAGVERAGRCCAHAGFGMATIAPFVLSLRRE
jgi:hypothetical protein